MSFVIILKFFSASTSWWSPSIWIFIPIVQRLKFLLTFSFAQLLSCSWLLSLFKEIWCYLWQPFGINCTDFSHVFFRSLNKFMIHYPLRTLIEKRTAGMNVNQQVVCKGFITFTRVSVCSIKEETSTNGLADLWIILHAISTWRDDWKFKSFHNLNQLLSHIFCSLQWSCLNEIFKTPLILTTIYSPCFVYSQISQVVAIWVIKLGSFLVC